MLIMNVVIPNLILYVVFFLFMSWTILDAKLCDLGVEVCMGFNWLSCFRFGDFSVTDWFIETQKIIYFLYNILIRINIYI